MARSAARHTRHNLPAQTTALVGRDRDIASLGGLTLSDSGRMVTLTGVGGCGKTRLALGVASRVVDSFRDGVWLVSLAPLADPLLVPQGVASVLGVHERPDRSLLDGLTAYLARRDVLLVLDNCEHLVQACAALADTLLQSCPSLRLLATSREPLRIAGEVVARVTLLAIPEVGSPEGPAEVIRYSAVQLFVERAVAARSDFVVTSRNASAVAAICRRLEGLPLALELAAPWVRALAAEQILERLDDTFGLLVGGSRSAPERQKTMLAALDWSYGLLGELDRVVFRRLAVFVGGWSIEAAEAVCSGGGVSSQAVLAPLIRLVDASLVQVEYEDERTRYRFLEPVRQYARERLVGSGELDVIDRRHARYFLHFAQHWEHDANAGGPDRQAAHIALEREQDNTRGALSWCVDRGEAEIGLQLGRAYWNLWVVRGLLTEGRTWLSQLAALPAAGGVPGMRVVALSINASLAWRQGSYAEAQDLYAEVLPVLRAGDLRMLQCALADLGWMAFHQGNYPAAQAHFDEELDVSRALRDPVSEVLALSNLGWLACYQEEYSAAAELSQECLVGAREASDQWVLGMALNIGANAQLHTGDLATARRLVEECVAVQRELGDRFELAYGLIVQGQIAAAEGQYATARTALGESLLVRYELGDRSGVAESMESLAALDAAERQLELAVQLAAAAAGVRERIGAPLTPQGKVALDQWLVPARKKLGDEATTRAWASGGVMSADAAVRLALAPKPRERNHTIRSPRRKAGQPVAALSPREPEVAVLLARGLSNRQIAGELVITERTVATHIEHMLGKLGYASRHQVAAWASEHGLAE
jgi:predicted ATPase/DNA-binding CsgD family transcriptional regulator